MKTKIVAVDIDGVLTYDKGAPHFSSLTHSELEKWFSSRKPRTEIIKKINELYYKYYIIIYTSRSDFFRRATKVWLRVNGVKYNELIFNKVFYDFIIDDKSIILKGVNDEIQL